MELYDGSMNSQERPLSLQGLGQSLFLAAILLAAASSSAQTEAAGADAQESFALAVAKAHARTSLFNPKSSPFTVRARIVSRLALHATGAGTYENSYIDAEHWERRINFDDFRQTEFRNDSGNHWVEQSAGFVPIRVAQMLYYVVFHLPSSTAAASFTVERSTGAGEEGEPLACYSAHLPIPADGFSRSYRWCFDIATGLLHSEDLPLDQHVVFGKYIAFQGKQEYTEVHVKAGNLPVLDIEVSYEPLDPHALDGKSPSPAMVRSQSAASRANPEEWEKGTVEYRAVASLPPGVESDVAAKPVNAHFLVGEESRPLDVAIEQAPSLPMAEAALQAARESTFTPRRLDGKPVQNNFFYSIWFQPGRGDSEASTGRPERLFPSAGKDGSETAVPLSPAMGTFLHDKPPFAMSYPSSFQRIPDGQIEEERRRAEGTLNKPESGPQTECQSSIFKAQRTIPGYRSPQVFTVVDVKPICVFSELNQKTLEQMAINSARSIVGKWKGGTVSRSSGYTVDRRPFAIATASGTPATVPAESLNVAVVVTEMQGHVVGWTVIGPQTNILQPLMDSLLQIGGKQTNPLLPSEYVETH
jgi:hypothetical protein